MPAVGPVGWREVQESCKLRAVASVDVAQPLVSCDFLGKGSAVVQASVLQVTQV